MRQEVIGGSPLGKEALLTQGDMSWTVVTSKKITIDSGGETRSAFRAMRRGFGERGAGGGRVRAMMRG